MRVAFVLRSIEAHPVFRKGSTARYVQNLNGVQKFKAFRSEKGGRDFGNFRGTVFNREVRETMDQAVCVFSFGVNSYHAEAPPI